MSAATDPRHDRQCRLPEVGSAGQARIAAATVELGAGPETWSAAQYLERAGVARVLTGAAATAPTFAHREHFQHAAPAELGHGAWQALSQLRRVLGLSPRAASPEPKLE